ncbi:Trm1p. N2,N2-dimethylguanosine tRNA methyltransferase, related [Eimeria brunetti]|uniref:Trm1p. N2,N2-dimethylguanosine tRNA methyltransferase, related n=1 Tax=Eimeria brunetti TaxID=51314 RepID=U6LFN0_9EIME|nr:Trm1p. N2,N2-dimethylguanosine tRNA methyltransferase, related [Eimeria brunetti]
MCSHFHRDPQAVKTNAPAAVVFDLLRAHAAKHPPANIHKFPVLTKPIQTKGIDLSPPSAEEVKRHPSKHIPRWLPNPTPHWGPKSRAGKRRVSVDKGEGPSSTKRQKETQEETQVSPVSKETVGGPPDKNPLL